MAVGAGDPGRDPAAVDRLHGPARQLLALPAARHRLALDGRPRRCAARGAGVRRGRPVRRARDAGPQRRPARPRRARPRLRLGPLAGLAVGAARRPPGDPVRGGRRRASRSSPSSWRRGGRASWRSSGRSRRRPRRARSCSSATSGSGTASRRRPRSSTCSGWASARCIATRIGGPIAAVMIYVTLVARVRPRARSWSSAAGRAAARRDFGPFFVYAGAPVRVLGARLGGPRPGRDVHPLGGRARAVQLHPGPRGDRRRRRLGRRAPAGVGRGHGDAASSAARRSAFAVVVRGRRARSSSTRSGRPRRDDVRRGRGGARRGRRADDATGSCRSTPPATKYWTGHGGVVLVNDPLDTIHEVARAYDIRWLVLDRGDVGRRRRADPRRRPARPGSAPPILSTTGSPTRSAVYPVLDARLVTRARSGPDRGSRIFVVALVVRVVVRRRRSSSRSPRTRPTTSASRATCSRAAGSSPTRCGATQTPPLVVPAPGVRGLAAAADLPRGDPDGDPRHDVRRPPRSRRSLIGALVPVLAWRLAADVAAERGLPRRPRPDARRSGRA